jgi:hypothetical protein
MRLLFVFIFNFVGLRVSGKIVVESSSLQSSQKAAGAQRFQPPFPVAYRAGPLLYL